MLESSRDRWQDLFYSSQYILQSARGHSAIVLRVTTNGMQEVRPVIQSVSRLVDIITGGDFLGICDQKRSYKHVSDFGRLRSYDRLKLRIEGNDY